MKAIVLAAGYGTRLYPLTRDCPKTLLRVAGRPMVEWVVEGIARAPGLDAVALVTNDRFAGHHERWLARYKAPCPVTVVNDGTTSDADKLGAVRDIQLAKGRLGLDDDLLVVAGDNPMGLDVSAFAAFFREKGAAAVALRDMKVSSLISRYSVVSLDSSSRITDFEEKPPAPRSSLIAICLYAFPRRELGLLDRYLAEGGNPDAPGYYIQWMVRETAAYGWVFDAPWFDVGDIDSYNEANARWGARQAER